jgi:hypothetical protein
MTDSPRKVKTVDRVKFRKHMGLASDFGNLYHQVKRVRGVI